MPRPIRGLCSPASATNLGLPLNPRVALFYQTKPDRFGFTPNPYGFAYRDLGLGAFLSPNSQWVQLAPTSDGQMQTSTARNVAMTPPQCPTPAMAEEVGSEVRTAGD